MAVELLGAINRYQGLSGDVKPTTGVKTGSQFFETDTRLGYVYNGAAWVQDAKVTLAGNSAVTIADGADVAGGTTTDAAVVTDADGTRHQYLRGLVKLIAEGLGKLIVRGGAKGATAAADVTSTAVDANTQGLDVVIKSTLPAFAATPDVNATVTGSNIGKDPSDSQTRPDNVTPYTAGDVVGDGTNLEFTSVSGTAGGLVAIMKAMLRINIAAIPTGMAGFKLHLFDAAPTPIADNAPFNIIAADRDKYLGWVTILTPGDLGDTLVGKDDGSKDVFKLAAASTTFYGALVTLGGYTPAAGLEVYVSELNTAEV